jgi:peptidoglycan/xylan/chitin deacetylase (PgdA/CDA1 family)
MYHRIGEVGSDPWSLCVTPEHLAEHLAVLKKTTTPVRLQQLIHDLKNKEVKPRSVVITFDDGYADNLHLAKPVIERFEVPATVFLITGNFETSREFWWDELEQICLQPGVLPEVLRLEINGEHCEWQIHEASSYTEEAYRSNYTWKIGEDSAGPRQTLYHSIWQRLQPLPLDEIRKVLNQLSEPFGRPEMRSSHRSVTKEEARKLNEGGFIEIGAHSVTHPLLPNLSKQMQEQEIQNSKAELETILGTPVETFAYPYGQYSEETPSIVSVAGFRGACTTVPTGVASDANLFELPRVQVNDWSGEEFSRHLSNWFEGRN